MASFDDLQFAGLSGATSAVHCPLCNRIYDLPPSAATCPNNHTLPLNTLNPLMPHNLPRPSAAPVSSSTSSSSASAASAAAAAAAAAAASAAFINFPALAGLDLSSLGGGANANFLSMLAAQQNLNMDDLMASLLNETSHNSTATSAAYLKTLADSPLTDEDFTQLALRVDTVDRDILPIQAEFGKRVRFSSSEQAETVATDSAKAKQPQEEEADKPGRIERQLSGRLAVAQPLDGKDLSNASELSGRVALLKRGRITFVDKCRAVQRAGAVLAVVQQTDDTWPYRMTDQTRSGGDIDIPCLLVSLRDGDALQAAVAKRRERAASGGGEQKDDGLLGVELLTRDRQLACPVCRDDFTLGENAIKLGCGHAYHRPCILGWLEKRNLCPLCRYELPTEGAFVSCRTRATAHLRSFHVLC